MPQLGLLKESKARYKLASKFELVWEKLIPGARWWERIAVQNKNVCVPGVETEGAQLRCSVYFDDVRDTPLATCLCGRRLVM